MVKYFLLIVSLLITFSFSALADETPHVSINKFEFIPKEITIKKGEIIRWTNDEKRQYHSVWFEEIGDEEPDYFFPGEYFERSFNQTGRFPYRCGPHPKMTGVVIVTE